MSSHVLAVKDGGVDVNSSLALFNLSTFGYPLIRKLGLGGFGGFWLSWLLVFWRGGGFAILRYSILIAINCI